MSWYVERREAWTDMAYTALVYCTMSRTYVARTIPGHSEEASLTLEAIRDDYNRRGYSPSEVEPLQQKNYEDQDLI